MQAVRGADVLMDHDPQCANWIQATATLLPEERGSGAAAGGAVPR